MNINLMAFIQEVIQLKQRKGSKSRCVQINRNSLDYRNRNSLVLYINGDKVTYLKAFALNIFEKKFKNLQGTKISKQIFIGYEKGFNNIWILLHWIYRFYAKR